MQKFKTSILLFLICLLSLFTLSYKLSETPNGVYLDEATTGYNAYSILKTGKDEYGKSFPIAFRFFGSYSPPLYTYLTTIPISIFGLNEFSTRIVSVICASLMILVLYQFLKQTSLINQKLTPLLLILFIITPWNFFYSRTGYEIYLGLFLFNLGALLCYLSLERKALMPIGLTILSLSTYGAHAQIYTAPIFIISFIILFNKLINIKLLLTGLIIALIIQIPHISLLGTQAFLNKSDLFYKQEIITNAGKIPLPHIISFPLSFSYSFFSRLTTYLSPYSLFFLPDPDPQRSIPEISVFYSWMLIPFLIGIYLIIKNSKQTFIRFLILLIVATTATVSLSGDPFSTQRSLSLLLPLYIIICIGLSAISEKINLKKFFLTFLLVFTISIILLWRSYFVLLSSERSVNWNYGFKEIARIIKENPHENYLIEQIHGKPIYIEVAFFLKTNPETIQNSVDPEIKHNYYVNNIFNPDYKFERIETRKLDWENDIYKPQIIIGDEFIVSESQAKEHFLTEVFTIKDPRGYPLLKGFKTNPQKKCESINNKSNLCTNSSI